MKLQRILLTGRFLILLAGSVLGLRASTLSDLATNADAVVVGTVTTRLEGRDAVTFDITVQRVLKGTGVPALVHVSHNGNGVQGPTATLDATVTGIWLLTKSSSGNWDVIACRGGPLFGSLFFPASGVPPGGLYAYSSSTSLQDSLTFEAASGIESLGNPQDLLSVISYGEASTRIVLGAFLASSNTSFKAVGLAGMLMMNHTGTLTALAELWPLLANEPNRTLVVSALQDDWRDTTPAGVGQLSALVSSATTTADLRAAAIRSLMASHTAASLPLFSRLLFGSDSDEQMEAAIAISAFVNGCSTQTPATVASLGHLNCGGTSAYQSDDTIAHHVFGLATGSERASAVAFWQAWWNSHPGVHY
jgi:hypothetical protein